MSEVGGDIIEEVRKFPGVAGIIDLFRQGKGGEADAIVNLGESLKNRLISLRDEYLEKNDVIKQREFIRDRFTLKYENDDIIFIFYLALDEKDFNKLLGLFGHSYNFKQLISQFSNGFNKDITFEEVKQQMFGNQK